MREILKETKVVKFFIYHYFQNICINFVLMNVLWKVCLVWRKILYFKKNLH